MKQTDFCRCQYGGCYPGAGEIGIRKDRSATWSATKKGETAVYAALDMAVTCCRAAKPIGSKWKKSIK